MAFKDQQRDDGAMSAEGNENGAQHKTRNIYKPRISLRIFLQALYN